MVPWFSCFHINSFGGEEGDRTPDLLLAKQLLSQLSYIPNYLVGKERLELSILSALASKTSVYTIPPLAHFRLYTVYYPGR